MELKEEILESVLKCIRRKGLIQVTDSQKYRLDFLLALEITIQYCIDDVDYIQKQKSLSKTQANPKEGKKR